MADYIKCPKCGGDVYAPTISGICNKCWLHVWPDGTTLPAPQMAHHNYPCDVVSGPCCCGAWHTAQEQIDRSRLQAAGTVR